MTCFPAGDQSVLDGNMFACTNELDPSFWLNSRWYVYKITTLDSAADVKEIKYLKGLEGFVHSKTQ